jgi:hypothetical protein
MKKLLNLSFVAIAAALMLFTACKQNSVDPSDNNVGEVKDKSLTTIERIKVIDGRLVFENYNHFIDAVIFLNKNFDIAEKLAFDEYESANSALNPLGSNYSEAIVENVKACNFPSSYLYLLNKDCEVQIGNIVSLYLESKKYSVIKGEEQKLKNIKNTTEGIKVCQIGNLEKAQPQSLIGISPRDISFRWSGESSGIQFYDALAHWLDIQIAPDGSSSNYTSFLALHVNMQQRKNGRWIHSNFGREVAITLSGNVSLINQVFDSGSFVGSNVSTNPTPQVQTSININIPNSVKFSETSIILAQNSQYFDGFEITIESLRQRDMHWRANIWGRIRQFIPGVPEFIVQGNENSPIW